jgi:hypothetical protein
VPLHFDPDAPKEAVPKAGGGFLGTLLKLALLAAVVIGAGWAASHTALGQQAVAAVTDAVNMVVDKVRTSRPSGCCCCCCCCCCWWRWLYLMPELG